MCCLVYLSWEINKTILKFVVEMSENVEKIIIIQDKESYYLQNQLSFPGFFFCKFLTSQYMKSSRK